MDERAMLKAIENLGYQLLPHPHRDSPGGSGVLVALRPEPTGEHFDPATMRLRLRDRQGMANWQSLSPQSPHPHSDRVCPGRVTLYDQFGERVEFYTFGSSLEVIPVPEGQLYALRSPAPVLELVAEEATVAYELAAETESWLGYLAVRWGHDEEGFKRRLAEIEPLQFYIGAVHSLLKEHTDCQALEETWGALCDLLHHEKVWLANQGLWPKKPDGLEELFAPG